MVKAKTYKKILDERESKCANPHIGVMIKRRRKDLNMTLEDATKGICCVSYLSKLEHGTIEPKRYVLNEVLDRLDMKEQNLRTKNEYLTLITNCMIEYYHKNYDYISKCYKNISEVEAIHFTDIIKALYFLSIDDQTNADKAINNALVVKNDLDNNEIYACIIISALILEKRRKYREALEIIKNLEHIYTGNSEIEKLKFNTLCRIYLVLGKYIPLSNALSTLENLCIKTVDFDEVLNVKKMYAIALAINGEEESALELYHFINRMMDDNEANDFLKNIYKALEKPNALIAECKCNNLDLLWAYDKLKDVGNCVDVLNNIKIEDINEPYLRYYVESLMKKYFENEYFFAENLRLVYYPYLLEHGYFEQAKKIQEILFEFLLADGKYRESVRLLKEFKKYF